jgi:hypothetical protein
MKYVTLYRISHTSLLQSKNSLCLLVSEEKILKTSANQKQELPTSTMFLSNRDEMNNLYKGPSIYASYEVLVHLARWFQRRRFLEIDPPETRIACSGHVC